MTAFISPHGDASLAAQSVRSVCELPGVLQGRGTGRAATPAGQGVRAVTRTAGAGYFGLEAPDVEPGVEPVDVVVVCFLW